MGRRGPVGDPAARALKGTERSGVRPKRIPQPPPGLPDCPDWLDEEGRAWWAKLLSLMGEKAGLTKADEDALAVLADTMVTYTRAQRVLREKGYSCFAHGGGEKARPEVAVAESAARRAAQLWKEFGLTPMARARLTLPPEPPPKDPIEDFLSRGKK